MSIKRVALLAGWGASAFEHLTRRRYRTVVCRGANVQILPDNPTSEDRLGFGHTVDALFQVITTANNPEMLPLTVGVFGSGEVAKLA